MTAKSSYKNEAVKHICDYPDILTVEGVSEMLGVSTKTVYKLIKEGKIKKRSVGRAFRIPKINVMNYLGMDTIK